MGRHGGGAFSGKDPTKVDRSAAYMARWVAKHIVDSGVADRCELQVAYAIGHPEPTSLHLDTFGTGNMSDASILAAVKEVFLFNPAEIIKQLDLRRPIYRASTHYGHFGKKGLPWEETKHLAKFVKALHQQS
jgi:S-adenosylmethionine synthetase